jgi:MFS family permease
MAVGVAPAVVDHVAAQIASRLLVGAGEGLMMSAAVLWLLRLGGPERRGRALGHIGLANYGGLACGPLLADAVGGYGSVLAIAAVLPLLGAAIRPRGAPAAAGAERDGAGLLQATAWPGVGLMLVNIGYAALLAFGGSRSAVVVPASRSRSRCPRSGCWRCPGSSRRGTAPRPGCSSRGSTPASVSGDRRRVCWRTWADRPVRSSEPPWRSPAPPRSQRYRPSGHGAGHW